MGDSEQRLGSPRYSRLGHRLLQPLEGTNRIANHWKERTELLCKRLLKWAGLEANKFHTWTKRYGIINQHNGQLPRDWWLENWEKQAILDFHDRYPVEGYRRLTFRALTEGWPDENFGVQRLKGIG